MSEIFRVRRGGSIEAFTLPLVSASSTENEDWHIGAFVRSDLLEMFWNTLQLRS